MDKQKSQNTTSNKASMKVNKFLFAEDFAIEQNKDDLPAISKNTLKQECEKSYQKGYEEGVATGTANTQAAVDAQNTKHLQQINEQLLQLQNFHQELAQKAHENVAYIVDKIVKKVLPVYVQAHGADEIIALIKRALEEMHDTPQLKVVMAPCMLESLKEKVMTLNTDMGFAGDIKLQTDSNLSSADCSIEWQGGGIERLTAVIFKNIESAVERMSPTAYKNPQSEEMRAEQEIITEPSNLEEDHTMTDGTEQKEINNDQE